MDTSAKLFSDMVVFVIKIFVANYPKPSNKAPIPIHWGSVSLMCNHEYKLCSNSYTCIYFVLPIVSIFYKHYR